MNDTRYLSLNYNTWVFKKRIPKPIRHLSNGSEFFIRSLQTSDLHLAKKLRADLLDWLEEELMLAIGAKGGATGSNDARYSSDKASYKAWLSRIKGHKEEDRSLEHLDIESLYDKHGEPVVQAYRTVIDGTQYPEYGYSLKEALSDYKKFKSSTLKSTKDLGKADLAVSSLLKYLGKSDIPLTEIRRKSVRHWLDEFISGKVKGGSNLSGKTKKNYISALMGIWKRAYDMEEIESTTLAPLTTSSTSNGITTSTNPFQGHSISTKDTQSYQLFNDSELKDIFIGTVLKEPLGARRLVPLLGLVTGARIEELCSLKIKDVTANAISRTLTLHIRDGKTKAAERIVPVHSSVSEELRAWLNVQQQERGYEYLFEGDLKPLNGIGGKWSHGLSKWFGRVKSKAIADSSSSSSRTKSFHSLRVHMATALERAGVLESTATLILGHERKVSMSYGLYSKGMSEEQLREAIESIEVPEFLTESL
ncbi:tyrosine-type recombinase/integrase [Endozoicomonas sp. SESOKO2]|uniref:tyrosine-type recombinase/integrase n=1 Tax=Endozoicomonas sp. SESOKO2 TaxID=2828743 RepID=UPI002148BF7E|nr:tyrosine-type recombinase/integrase [Endozoicomonas sp. SESOKO2]